MKKILTLAVALAVCGTVAAQNGWRVGLTAGSFGNQSVFSGGTSSASALYTHQKYGTGMWGVLFRKQINNHLSFQTGLNFSSLGFQYTMAQDYSLFSPKGHYLVNKTGFGIGSIPATLIWNFNPNCRNWRWFVGGGVSLLRHNISVNKTNAVAPSSTEAQQMGMTTSDNLSQTITSSSFTTLNGHVLVGIEKLFKKGSMLSFALYLNRGFSPLATSTVNYTVNGQAYTHIYTNYNNYAGWTVSYYFKPLKSKTPQIKKTIVKPSVQTN
jgi:hypothetical protein